MIAVHVSVMLYVQATGDGLGKAIQKAEKAGWRIVRKKSVSFISTQELPLPITEL